jgi:hypothetical protein
VCYETLRTGFGSHRYLAALGVNLVLVASSLIPEASDSRVKLDRRDSRKRADYLGTGDLTPAYTPVNTPKLCVISSGHEPGAYGLVRVPDWGASIWM